MSDVMAGQSAGTEQPTPADDSKRSLWGDVRYELARKPLFWVSLVLVLIVMSMAFFPQLWASESPNARGACALVNARKHFGAVVYPVALFILIVIERVGVGIFQDQLGLMVDNPFD